MQVFLYFSGLSMEGSGPSGFAKYLQDYLNICKIFKYLKIFARLFKYLNDVVSPKKHNCTYQ